MEFARDRAFYKEHEGAAVCFSKQHRRGEAMGQKQVAYIGHGQDSPRPGNAGPRDERLSAKCD